MARISKRIERLPLGPIAALMLGGAVAFFCLAMPAEILARLIGASGLPNILLAAQPPLGATARALVAGGAGIGAFAAVLGGFLLSGRPPRPKNEDAVEYVPAAPRSAVPQQDVPARRPLFAASDLGTPYELTDPLAEVDAEAVEPVWRFESGALEEVGDEEPEEADWLADEPEAASVSARARVETIPALMARLEAGIARRAARPAGETPVTSIRPDIETPARSHDPLREALDQLQRMARGR